MIFIEAFVYIKECNTYRPTHKKNVLNYNNSHFYVV